MTCFIKDSSSYTNLFVTLKTFGECSGLKINNEKTETLALGNSSSLWEGYSDMPNLCNTIKILGVYFGYDAKQRDELNFRNTLKSLKKTINFWKWRGLSLLGRIQIISAGHRHFCLYGFLQHDWSRQNQNKEIWPRGTGSTQTLCTEM